MNVANIERKQGDTYPVDAIIMIDGVPYDFTGTTALTLGVSANQTNTLPSDAEFTQFGVIDADPTSGKCSFDIPQALADAEPGTYYAEIQFVQGGYKRTTDSFNYVIRGQIITS